jgi:DNA-binding NtrC family response regulator
VTPPPLLLAVVEMGGYPNFAALYRSAGFQAELLPSMRKAQAWLKQHRPRVVVTEFNFDPEFRDRMSNLESLLATLQRYHCPAKVIVLLDPEHRPRLARVAERFPIFAALEIPVGEGAMQAALRRALTDD